MCSCCTADPRTRISQSLCGAESAQSAFILALGEALGLFWDRESGHLSSVARTPMHVEKLLRKKPICIMLSCFVVLENGQAVTNPEKSVDAL